MASKNIKYIRIKIVNWDKYQDGQRKNSRAKKFTWWARDNGFYRDDKMRQLGSIGRDLFASLLDRASERNSNEFSISLEHLARDTSSGLGGNRSITRSKLVAHLEFMQALKIIEFDFTHNITEQNNNRTEEDDLNLDDLSRAREGAIVTQPSSSSSSQNVIEPDFTKPKKPKPIDPFAPKPIQPDETPYAEILELWNNLACPPGIRIEIFSLGAIRQQAIKNFWAKHPDFEFWERWITAWKQSFWINESDERKREINIRRFGFDKMLAKDDLIYGLLETKYIAQTEIDKQLQVKFDEDRKQKQAADEEAREKELKRRYEIESEIEKEKAQRRQEAIKALPRLKSFRESLK